MYELPKDPALVTVKVKLYVPAAKNAALAAVAAAMAATAAGAAPQKSAVANQAIADDESKPRRWIVKKTLNKFKANLRSVPDYYLPKFIQLIAAEVAPRCDGDQQLSRSPPTLVNHTFLLFLSISLGTLSLRAPPKRTT